MSNLRRLNNEMVDFDVQNETIFKIENSNENSMQRFESLH
jgi:hypothetical protein